jgi:hypothetical protein
LISGTEDHTVSDVTTRSTLKLYRNSTAVTELKYFEHRSHFLTIDSGWHRKSPTRLCNGSQSNG